MRNSKLLVLKNNIEVIENVNTSYREALKNTKKKESVLPRIKTTDISGRSKNIMDLFKMYRFQNKWCGVSLTESTIP